MASDAESQRLIKPQIVRLAAEISEEAMTKIALAYLNISHPVIASIRHLTSNLGEFNKEVLTWWMDMNPDNQRQVR